MSDASTPDNDTTSVDTSSATETIDLHEIDAALARVELMLERLDTPSH
jgi:hypothetical protein